MHGRRVAQLRPMCETGRIPAQTQAASQQAIQVGYSVQDQEIWGANVRGDARAYMS